MTPDEVGLVKDSFREALPNRTAAAALFYERLFAIDPTLRALFSTTDMEQQGHKFMTALAFVVHGLDRAETILPAVRQLAQRHVGYGAKDEHYATVGQALIETLATGLGTRFTPEVRAAWQAAYALLTTVMIEAAGGEATAG
jgi:hemoglobin-like flavoprotein